jgi:arginine exporter protein ArgO
MQTSFFGDIFINSFSVFIGSLSMQIVWAIFGAYLGKIITDAKTINILNIVSGIVIVMLGFSSFF